MRYELQHVTRGGESFFAVIAAGCIAAELRDCANESQAGEAFHSYKARAAALGRITINGHAFARNDRQFDAECRGFFQPLRGGLLLLGKDKQPVACLVMNRHGERFFVSATACNGRTYYMYSTSASADAFLGLTGLSYLRRNAIAEQAAREFLSAPIRLAAQRETHSRRANG